LAFYDDQGWQPTPYIPWHQPFFNAAGAFHARVTLPSNQKIACTGSIVGRADLGHGEQQVDIAVDRARDFAFLCSDRYCEYLGNAGPVLVRVMAFPEHEFHARKMVQYASEAIETYSRWFGPYAYPEFTVAESYFGWNGNECAGLVMIDERVFGMPHLADGFVEQLVTHETCHQWWYNAVGTNGYAETWMDEGLATYFSHRLMDQKYGKNNALLHYPSGLEWLPNIYRETYRNYGLMGTIGRGEASPVVQPIDRFDHIVNLFSMCYDRGSRIVGMIEDRLGEAAFLDFMRRVYAKYYFGILRVEDFRRELEAYTGNPWGEFFHHWLYSADMTDWAVEDVKIEPLERQTKAPKESSTPCRAIVLLRQKGQYNEQTTLGIRLQEGVGYDIRIPIVPAAGHLELDEPSTTVETLPNNTVRVEVVLPSRPVQIAVDPDQLLPDPDFTNNTWKPEIRWRFTPLYTPLDETDLTATYDRWNIIMGPWLYAVAYDDPWYTRSPMVGFRIGAYRTQEFIGGLYAAYRTDFSDVVVGADALWDHWPWCHTQVGVNAEMGVTSSFGGDRDSNRAVLFGRYVFQYGDSLYLPPMHYLEAFGAINENALPLPRETVPDADHFDHTTSLGLHYHVDYLTPYWDPEGGFKIDATYATGIPIFGENESFNRIDGQLSFVKGLPDGLGWLSETSIAARAFGGTAAPARGEFFPLGGSDRFRGFDIRQEQGSSAWIASAEWRFPILKGLRWDCCDRTVGIRAISGALFYDAGAAYLDGHTIDGVAHALGGGIRLDMAWFSFVERSTIRFDVAKTVNENTPLQFWVAFNLPF
jgi:hypothetical protein